MKNFQCSKCGTLLNSNSTPRTDKCPSGGLHDWRKLGDVGNTPYQCRKCGTLVKSNSIPRTDKCPSGGLHDWRKL